MFFWKTTEFGVNINFILDCAIITKTSELIMTWVRLSFIHLKEFLKWTTTNSQKTQGNYLKPAFCCFSNIEQNIGKV